MKKLLRWLLKKAYKEEFNSMFEVINNQRTQIRNLKERIHYLQNTNIFNFEERKYHNEHL
ncbi:hypothetical protein [Sigmofec virus UA08Rod_5228]|uniref:Uncharacterized protein n=1 Tax=Sigmofec virus UA08Rod_5228 TaxID=2929416 RepID=A0A976R809_9VIRU|nr:hypothetical protein [Sigmofec virus UA08Rod_5228]